MASSNSDLTFNESSGSSYMFIGEFMYLLPRCIFNENHSRLRPSVMALPTFFLTFSPALESSYINSLLGNFFMISKLPVENWVILSAIGFLSNVYESSRTSPPHP